MRAVLHRDIVALAKCLLALPCQQRASFATLQLQLAHAADCYRIRFGKVHEIYGNGTLGSCCAKAPYQSERPLDDPDYVDCMIKALEAAVAFREGHPRNL
jgi:hypothetical protein